MSEYAHSLRIPAEMLGLSLPTDLQTLLLRVCLVDAAEVRPEWERWAAATPRAKYVLGGRAGVKRVLALLYWGAQRQGIVLEKELGTYLRAACLREQVRFETVRAVCGEALGCLAARGVVALVLKGVMAAETLYPEAWLRHCHDLDLLVPEEQLDAAAGALREAGFEPRESARPPHGSVALVHGSGFPVSLHTQLFRAAAFNAGLADIWRRSVAASLAGAPVRLLPPADTLVHLLVHAATTGSRISPCWAADAWFLIARRPDLDWERVVALATGHRALPLALTWEYLARRLAVPAPAPVLENLRAQAVAAGPLSREAARLAVVLSAQVWPLGVLRRCGGWRQRLVAAWWLGRSILR